jgi:alpha-methylacyl-CoA racemase
VPARAQTGEVLPNSPRPLDGLRAVNLGINLPAPAAAARLAELGAAVTKVEPPAGDPIQATSPAWYAELTRGQAILRLDLKADADRRRLADLLDEADLLLTSTRPAALARLGLGPAEVGDRHPRLAYVAIVGYPRPREDLPGHDLTYLAPLGLLSPPALPRTLIADLAGAERAVSAAIGLLLQRERGAGGRYAEVALSDAAAFFSGPWRHGMTAERGLVGGGSPFYALYEARGGWVALAALEPHFQQRLLVELDLREPDPEALAARFRARAPAEWEEWAAARDLPLAAVGSTETGGEP